MNTLLPDLLSVAVPLWIDKIKSEPFETIQARAKICFGTIAHKGDTILFKSKKKGETAEGFNRLAEGIACLSFCPGGVTAFGSHFEAKLSS